MSKLLYRIVSFIVGRRCQPPSVRLNPYFGAFFLCIYMLGNQVVAQDTIQVLDEVEVSTQRTPSTLRTASPTQVMDASTIEAQGALQLSDAVRQMAGVTLKDYGGIGGMKTVSARGLGSQFSAVTIDGVPVENAQNGQVDLGRYLLGNAAYVSFSQGQEQQSLLTARARAAGNVLNLETSEPQFFELQRNSFKLGLEAGSFGLWSPSAQWEHRWTRKLKSSLWVNYLRSDGDYPFTLYYTSSRSDSTSRERRLHSAMHMLSADANLFYRISDSNRLTFKVHLMDGWHQLPGHVRFYRQEPSAESTTEQMVFAQMRWYRKNGIWQSQVVAKWQYSNDIYEDSNYLHSTSHYLMNRYRQQEGYASASVVGGLLPWLDVGAAVDGDLSRLWSNLGQRNDVLRGNVMGDLSVRLHSRRCELSGHLLANGTADVVADIDTMPRYNGLSPYVALMYNPTMGLTLRYFYKSAYRVPTFSELYFFQSLPRQLRPERAHQHNVGLTYSAPTWGGTLDVYFNRVTDKIVARPGQNMFYWTMENLGLVHILGVDATLSARLGPVEVQANYSFAHAVDRTDPESVYYGHQIRYTPRHSGGGSLRWENRWVNVGLTAMVVGRRYTMPQNTPENCLPAYCDLGIGIDRRIPLRWGNVRLQAQVLNLADAQYEVVQFYPMMGRNYRLSVVFEL